MVGGKRRKVSQRFGAEDWWMGIRKRAFRQRESRYKIPVVGMVLACSENSPEAIVPWSTAIRGWVWSGQSPNLLN